MRKRIISTLMALCMALTLLPVQVLAANYAVGEDAGVSARALAGTAGTELKADNIDAYVANGLGGGVYTLAEDVTISGTLKVTGEAAVDLNGYVLRYADTTANGSVFEIVSGGDLTVIDSRPNVEHKFVSNADGLWVLDEQNGTEIVRGGIITGGTGLTDRNNNGYGGGVYVDGGGRFTMTGGSIVGCKAEGYIAFGGGVFVAKGGQFTMTGGSIVGCTAVADEYGHAYGGGTVGGTVVLERNSTIQGSGSTFSGLIINNDAQTQFSGAHSPLGIVGEEPVGANGYSYHKVAFDTAGGNMSHTTRYFLQGKDISNEIKPDPRTGYTFGGWNKADGTAWDHASDTVTDNITLYAKWTANTYTVTFDSTGGSAVDAQPVAYGEKAKKPAAPQKTGYAFGGWYLGEEAYDFAAVVTEDMTLTAKWTVCGHKGSTAQPTCTDAVKCTVCGSTLPALGHEWGPWTSGSDNTHTRACKRDGAHTETKSCVDADRDHMCEACGQTISGHTGGTATCTAKAVCSVCGKSYGAVDTANHDLKRTAAKEPGAFVTGRIEYWTCRACGKYFADAGGAKEISRDDIIIPRLGAAADSEGGKVSPATFDAGIGVSAVTAVTSLAGLALLRRKRRDGE